MGILSNIFNKVFHSSDAAPAPVADAAAPAATPDASAAASAPAPAAAMQEVDVEAVLDAMPQADNFNWRTSIVDLLKLLELDSSLSARKELAEELDFSGDTNDSAAMNVWLHKQVMNKLAANGGKVPADLQD